MDEHTEDHPPPTKEDVSEPPGTHISYSRNSRDASSLVLLPMFHFGSVVSRVALYDSLHPRLHVRCVSNSYPFNK
jgi:hypothetical protein